MEDLQRLDIIALKRLYIEKTKELNSILLKGVEWKQADALKREVTQLSIELDKRLHRDIHPSHPAANIVRNS
jgi:hypothetical protein